MSRQWSPADQPDESAPSTAPWATRADFDGWFGQFADDLRSNDDDDARDALAALFPKRPDVPRVTEADRQADPDADLKELAWSLFRAPKESR